MQTTVYSQSHLQPSTLPGIGLQRKCACGQHTGNGGECESCKKKRIQRKATNHAEPSTVPPIVREVLRSPGQPLDPATRAFMEPRFGHDFSGVRVHTDAKAAESAREVNALAYTVGKDVVFGDRQYTPGTQVGRKLFAHELTHVIQQRGSQSLLNTNSLKQDSNFQAEFEAEKTANDIITSNPLTQPITPGGAQLQKQKAPDEEKKKFRFSSGLEVDQELLSSMLAQCNLGKLEPTQCVNLRMEVARSFQASGAFEKSRERSPLGVPQLELGKKPQSFQVPSFDELEKNIFPKLPILPGVTPAPSSTSPGSTPVSSSSGLPDIGIAKLTTHEFDVRIGSFKITLPKSAEFKFSKLSMSPGSSAEISVKGEITELGKLFGKSDDDKALGPPVRLGLSIKLNGIPRITIEATSSYDLSNKTLKSGLNFKLIGQNCLFIVPKSAIDKIKEAEKVFQKYTGSKQTPEGDKIEAPPDDTVKQALEIAENIDKLYQAIKEIDDAKEKCQQTPTLEFGPQITIPFDSDERPPDDPLRRPNYGLGFKYYF